MARNQALALVLLMILQTVSVTVGDSDYEGTVETNSNPDAHQHDANLFVVAHGKHGDGGGRRRGAGECT